MVLRESDRGRVLRQVYVNDDPAKLQKGNETGEQLSYITISFVSDGDGIL